MREEMKNMDNDVGFFFFFFFSSYEYAFKRGERLPAEQVPIQARLLNTLQVNRGFKSLVEVT